jgi:hypothetical protein
MSRTSTRRRHHGRQHHGRGHRSGGRVRPLGVAVAVGIAILAASHGCGTNTDAAPQNRHAVHTTAA